jgi:cytochrome c oxidase subunit 2
VPVAVLIVYFAVKYRRGVAASRLPSSEVGRHGGVIWLLETSWIAIPFVLAMGIFTWGARLYVDIYALPPAGMDVYVVGRQWMWKFQQPTGQTEINTLHVPLGQTVRLTMISEDVIHSFFVPAFRIKRDVLPGYYTTLWFEATQPGTFHLFCAEYCGTEHSSMVGQIVVLEPNQYQVWLSEHPVGNNTGPIPEAQTPGRQQPQTMAQGGAALFESLGCSSCHQMDGRGVGPSLVGLYGREVELEDGQTVVADLQYIRNSILEPSSQVVAGYSPVMPSFAGQIAEEQVLSLIEYIRSLADETGEPDQTGATTTPEAQENEPGALPTGVAGDEGNQGAERLGEGTQP